MMSWCDVHVECFLNRLKDLCNCVGPEPSTSGQKSCSAVLLVSLLRVYNIEQFLPLDIQLS